MLESWPSRPSVGHFLPSRCAGTNLVVLVEVSQPELNADCRRAAAYNVAIVWLQAFVAMGDCDFSAMSAK